MRRRRRLRRLTVPIVDKALERASGYRTRAARILRVDVCRVRRMLSEHPKLAAKYPIKKPPRVLGDDEATRERVRTALRRSHGSRYSTARRLKVSLSAVNVWLRRHKDIRKEYPGHRGGRSRVAKLGIAQARMRRALEATDGNRTKAASRLKLKQSVFRYHLQKFPELIAEFPAKRSHGSKLGESPQSVARIRRAMTLHSGITARAARELSVAPETLERWLRAHLEVLRDFPGRMHSDAVKRAAAGRRKLKNDRATYQLVRATLVANNGRRKPTLKALRVTPSAFRQWMADHPGLQKAFPSSYAHNARLGRKRTDVAEFARIWKELDGNRNRVARRYRVQRQTINSWVRKRAELRAAIAA